MRAPNPLWVVWPFWLYIFLYKIGASLHYSAGSPLGEQVLPIWTVGLVIGLAAGIQVVFDVPAGFLLDRFGYRRLLKIGTFIFLVAVSCLFFGLTPATYLLAMGLGALGWLFFWPGVSAYTLATATRATAGKFVSLRDVSSSLGTVIAVLIFPLVIRFPIQYIAGVMFFFLAISMLALMITPRERMSVHEEKKIATQHYHVRRHYVGRILKAMKHLDPASGLLVLQGFSSSVFYATIWFVVPLMIVRAGSASLGWGLAAFDLAVVTLGFAFGALADRLNKRLLVLGGLLVFSVSGALLGFNFNWWFVILGFLATAGDELSSVSLWAWLDNLNSKHTEDGLISGAITASADLGWAVGPILAGILFGLVGPTWTIVAGSFLLFLTWIISVAHTTNHPGLKHALPARHAKPHRHRHKT